MSDDEMDGPAVFEGTFAPVTAYLNDELVTVAADATLRDVARTIAEQTVGLVVVGSADRVEGVVSERDVAVAVAGGTDLDAATAGQIAANRLVWVASEATIGEVATQMVEGYVRHVLVGDGERLVGVVSMRDVIAALIEI